MCLWSGIQFYNLHTLSAKADQISAETFNSQEGKKKKKKQQQQNQNQTNLSQSMGWHHKIVKQIQSCMTAQVLLSPGLWKGASLSIKQTVKHDIHVFLFYFLAIPKDTSNVLLVLEQDILYICG